MSKFPVAIFFLIGILFGLNQPSGLAMQPYAPKIVNPLSETWRWKHFPELEGKGVRDIAEEKNGTVWFGVDDGIFEYNGYEWKLHKNNENGLADIPIEQIHISEKGNIYAISTKQIFQYKDSTWHSYLNFPLDLNLVKFIELSDGSFMLSSEIGVLHLFQSGEKIFYSSAVQIEVLKSQLSDFKLVRIPDAVTDGETFRNISDVLEERSGKVWFALTFGEKGKLLRFHPSEVNSSYITEYEHFSSDNSSELGEWQFGEGQKLIESNDHKIWVVSSSYISPINIFSNGKWETLSLGEKFGGDEHTNDIMQTKDGTIWVGGLGKLYAFKNNTWTLYDAPEYKIPANKLKLYNSLDNKIWIAGLRSKVHLLDYSTNRWHTYQDLNFQCETTLLEQWFLSVEGNAISKNGNRWFTYGIEDGLMDAPIKIIVTKSGQIWAAGSHQGVAATAYFKNDKWVKQLHPTLSWGIDYRAVFEAKDGSIWFGGSVDVEVEKGQLSGVIQLRNPLSDTFNWKHLKFNEKGLIQSNSYGIGQTADGKIWIGGSSLFYFDGQKWDRPQDERLRQFVNIVASTEDLLIVGSRYYGIYFFDGENWKNYTTESGLTNNTIISIDAIANDNIWIATENDISHFDGKHWHNNIFPIDFNMGFEGGDIQHSADGSVWINLSDRGWKRRAFNHNNTQQNIYNNFFTCRYTPDNIPPETKITFFTKEVSSNGNTTIQWEGKDFFENSPNEALSYSYRINDGEWSAFSKQQQHTFLNLPNGKYRLEVKAMDLGSNIDKTPAVIDFLVQPPVWKQAWFIALVSSLLLIITLFGYNIFTKNNKLEKLNAYLNKVNKKIKKKGKKIKSQNIEILKQQKVILEQKQSLEFSNENLEIQNHEIQTQRDQLELMVGQVEELSKSKLKFFTNISHELRTPLSLILGPINQLSNTQNELTKNETNKLYQLIERNASRLLKLINQLLEIRSIENSSMSLNLKKTDLNIFLFNITTLFQNLSKKRNILFNYNSSIQNSLTLLDTDKVEKIIVNLLANAFKHTPEHGSIRLNLETVTGKDHRLSPSYEKYFLISVIDTGKGISPKVMEHIFERYYHQKSLDKKHNSSGIGLSYIKDLIEIHQGVIRVQSKVGEGSQFDIFLPMVENEKTLLQDSYSEVEYEYAQQEIHSALAEINEELTNISTSINDTAQKQTTLLIVEDNPDMLSFLHGLLEKEYQIFTAQNGLEALTVAQAQSIDLIISDVMMPEMDGLEFCERIKVNFATSHIPILLLTAKSLEEQQLKGYEVGADDYIVKPFNPKILRLKIGNILKQKTAFQNKINLEFQITPKEVQVISPDEKMLQNLVALMEANIENSNFNVNAMCKSVNLSHMHFIRKVKQLTGKRPVDLLKSFRMKRAKDLLLQNKMTISEVAYNVGFEMPSSFSRAFKKEFGQSPTDFLVGK